jgi:predicted nuclease of restriction endonuclease-like RecB superfamily
MRHKHAPYVGLAERMLDVYRSCIGKARHEIHSAVRRLFSEQPECPVRRIEAFIKLLDDVSNYEHDRSGQAAELRRQVFRRAAAMHPLVREHDRQFPNGEQEAKCTIAAQLGRGWDEIDGKLFADVPDFQRLQSFEGYPSAVALLARYNVAQVQVALFDAVTMTVWADQDFKPILRHAKLAGLMHTIRLVGKDRYELRFDGPATKLRITRRYGVAMAKFLPALLACRGWRMHAVLRTQRLGWNVRLDLSPDDGLASHLPPPSLFDSGVEEEFARQWGDAPRGGWAIRREATILHQGQKVFIPDFSLRHEDGREVLLEIVGFWTPEYLEAKAKTLSAFRDRRILLAVGVPAFKQWGELSADLIRYKTRLKIDDVLERLNGIH